MSGFEQFKGTFNPADFVSWMIVVLLTAVLGIQLVLVIRNQTLSGRRKAVRLVLNLLFWLVLLAYFLQIECQFPVDRKPLLLAADEVPTDYVAHLKDSLNLGETARLNAFKDPGFKAKLLDGTVDSVVLVGTGFSPDVLGQLSRQSVRWVPYYRPDQLQLIRWKGIRRKGEWQTVSGVIQSSRKQMLSLRFGNQTLDSLPVPKGAAAFHFRFLVFSQGRTAVELMLDQKPLDTLRFFARKAETVSYQFVLDNPDFESKTLADWLGQKGNSVELTSLVAKDIRNRVQINRAIPPDVIITTPGNADNPVVKKAVSQGKPVLFMNGADPEADSKLINRALGTNWQVKKISNEAAVSLGNGVQALPYQFRDALNQFPVAWYPVAVQKTAAPIGWSLLSETFPLKLSGDSMRYDRIWTAVLAQLQPSSPNNIQVDAPVFNGFRSVIQFNNLVRKPAAIHLETDTVRLDYSVINGMSAEVSYAFGRSGWQPFLDSLEVYVDQPDAQNGFGGRFMTDYVRARSAESSPVKGDTGRLVSAKIPEWVWLILFLGCLTALWIEPKFSV